MDWCELESDEGVRRQATAEILKSKMYPELALRSEDQQPLYKYAYYVHLRLREAWRVPLLYGDLPGPPHADASAYQKGSYGLMMFLLFKSHRCPEDLWDFVFGKHRASNTIDEAYEQIYNRFLRWRDELSASQPPQVQWGCGQRTTLFFEGYPFLRDHCFLFHAHRVFDVSTPMTHSPTRLEAYIRLLPASNFL